VYFVQFAYRDKKVVGVFVRFSLRFRCVVCALHLLFFGVAWEEKNGRMEP
jgi:hypothetical protein